MLTDLTVLTVLTAIAEFYWGRVYRTNFHGLGGVAARNKFGARADWELRFAQVLEDEGGLGSGEEFLVGAVAGGKEGGIEVAVVLNPHHEAVQG